MGARRVVIGVAFATLLLSGCTGNISAAVKAYATTAEEQANVMAIMLDRCQHASQAAEREAACQAVRASIEVYRQSAAELKAIKSAD